MTKIGAKELQLRALRERRGTGGNTETVKQEKTMTTKKQTKAEPKVRREKKAAKPAAGKRTRVAGVDRSPLAVGTFIAREGGASMAELEKQFKMDAHPLRAKIHDARHKLGFAITHDAKQGRYFGKEPKHKAAA